ncbi:hypothetical protein ZIOFF_046172 [Zingiber officinale]|uniref:UDP-glycosyltransferases domain-containing protein n=1 Tax=Zingiber officinale TaxID=94328 RepID=A0A8J5FYJ5_ZINOF|nr:hypothetical protein ZIOFF_046172 [Zingiber officinale]
MARRAADTLGGVPLLREQRLLQRSAGGGARDAEAGGCDAGGGAAGGISGADEGEGMVWSAWAPQAEILAHRAAGGFVTHCGWNSCLESLQCGAPLLGWPLYAEQHLNAVVMAEKMGVALQLKVERAKGNFVKAEELERGVRALMGESDEGRRVRANCQGRRDDDGAITTPDNPVGHDTV